MITTLWASLLIAPIAHILAASDVLAIPKRTEAFPNPFSNTSIISNAQLSAELEYVDFAFDPSYPRFVGYQCTDCPLAVVDHSSNKGYRWTFGVPNELRLVWSVENEVLNLNHHPLLDNEMNDLHQPQTTNQYQGLSSDVYTDLLPIEYSVKVVQTSPVVWQGQDSTGDRQGGAMQFYSVDFEILKLGDQDFSKVDVPKINLHVFRRKDGVVSLLYLNIVPPTLRIGDYIFLNASENYTDYHPIFITGRL